MFPTQLTSPSHSSTRYLPEVALGTTLSLVVHRSVERCLIPQQKTKPLSQAPHRDVEHLNRCRPDFHSKLWTGEDAPTTPRKSDDCSTTPRLVNTARPGSGQGGKTKQRICSLTTTLEPKWPRRNETMIDSMMTLCRYIQECIPHNLHHHINHHPDQKGSRCFIGHDSHCGRVPVERRFRPQAETPHPQSPDGPPQ